MSGQDARIAEFCEQLKLIRLASEWPGLARRWRTSVRNPAKDQASGRRKLAPAR
jgi:hypothetical protein